MPSAKRWLALVLTAGLFVSGLTMVSAAEGKEEIRNAIDRPVDRMRVKV